MYREAYRQNQLDTESTSELQVMPEMKVGDVIGVQCIVQPGPFSDERLITFDTTDGPISGFVEEAELRQVGKTWLVRAVIMAVRDDFLEVRVRGSFFTTNGLANIQKHHAVAA
jgi:hypothetical protein